MDWRTSLVLFSLVLYADGFSKYGRTCKDIGCLNSEVCVLAEDPCSFGHTSDCGTYPTCKKKSKVEGSHALPDAPRPTTPKLQPYVPPRDDIVPNYPPPAPPRDSSPYGNNSPYGGQSPYGGNSPYGGSPSNGGGSPYGGSPYGGTNQGGSSFGGGSPYGGSSPYGGNSPYGGSSSNGGGSPSGGRSPYGGSSPYDNSNHGGSNPYGGKSPYGSSSGGSGSPLDSILNTLNKYANSGGGGGGSTGGSSGLSGILGGLVNTISKNGGLNSFFSSGGINTRPIMENPNYSSYSANSRSSNPQYYPSGQPSYQTPVQNKNYGQSNAHRNAATTYRPVSYGWNVG